MCFRRFATGRRSDGPSRTARPVEQRENIWPPAPSRRALAHVVPRRKLDVLDAASERADVEREVDVRGPSVPCADWTASQRTQEVAKHGDSYQAEAGERICHGRKSKKGRDRPSAPPAQPSLVGRRGVRHGAMHRHQIGAAFEPFHQLREMLRRLREVALQQDHRVASGVFVIGGDVADEGVNAASVTPMPIAPDHRERHHGLVRFEHLVGPVRARVVINDDVVFPREPLKHRPEPPEQDADRGGLVVDRDADAEHVGRVGGNTKRTSAKLTLRRP